VKYRREHVAKTNTQAKLSHPMFTNNHL